MGRPAAAHGSGRLRATMPHDEPLPFAAVTLIGESFAGSGPNAAHLNVVIGRKGGPVEIADCTVAVDYESDPFRSIREEFFITAG